jgi:hypothetical protein
MRIVKMALAAALAVSVAGIGTISVADAAKAPAKTKLGCMVGKEKWDASVGKCAPAPKKAVAKKKK